MKSPINTLFLLQSLDGKIKPGDSGDTENLSQGREFAKIKGLQEGIKQYYELEQKTDLHSLNTGRVMKKIGINRKDFKFNIYSEMNFIIVDNKHLNKIGIEKLAKSLKKVYFITKNKNHLSFELQKDYKNIEILYYENEIDFIDMMDKLKNFYNIDKITIQSGGTLNAELLKNNLIDKISIVIAPVLIGGKDTPSLVDGESIHNIEELNKLKVLKFKKVAQLENGYLHLEYDVMKNIEINSGFDVPN
ncbi:MAG: dihydrofolate reductase family protein [Candidatus Gracilibacteria bacterium]